MRGGEYIKKPSNGRCFACGITNKTGLNMQFFVNGENMFGETILKDNHQGWDGIAHGGIVSTILDETMSWLVLYFKRSFFVTKSMEITFVRPVRLGTRLLCKAYFFKDGPNKNDVKAGSVLYGPEDEILARGKATFSLVAKEKLMDLTQKDYSDMEELFKTFELKD